MKKSFLIISFFLNYKFLTDSIWRRPIFAAIIQTSGIKPTVFKSIALEIMGKFMRFSQT